MKISCTRDNLHQALSITSHLTGKNPNLPVLENVLIKAEAGGIRFTTTNLEIAVHCLVRGKVEEGGECTVPSKLFSDYVGLLPNETVQMTSDGDSLDVSCGTYETVINGMGASEFPLVPETGEGERVEIPVDDLRQALSQVLFAVAANEARPELAGVSMRFGGGTLVMAATDSYRLAERTLALPGQVSELSLIVPSRALSELGRILSIFKDEVESPSGVTMSVSEGQVVFSYGGVELISRTIEGTYPDYGQIIPKDFNTEATLDRADFAKAVKAASLFSRAGLFDVTLELDPGSSEIRAKAVDANRGKNTATAGASATGQENAVTVNFRYLLDGLGALGGEEVRFQMIDASNPCLLTGAGEQGGYLYIVMPIRQ